MHVVDESIKIALLFWIKLEAVLHSLSFKRVFLFSRYNHAYSMFSCFNNIIFQSRKPEAEKFADWVMYEVLPAIVYKGVYMTDKKAYDIAHDRSRQP